jgi:transcriptional regulator with XRE-family HTH domain
MSTSHDLVEVLKRELKRSGVTYASLARSLGMAESSVKRMFAKADMPLARVDEICRVLKTDFAELAREVAALQPLRDELSLEQEEAVVADRKLLLLAICVQSQWTFEQVLSTYRFTEPEVVSGFARLDRLGIIELKPLNRYRLRVAQTFRWRPHGPVMRFFREEVVGDYYAGGFDGDGETLVVVHGAMSHALATAFVERMRRVGDDFARQHLSEQRLPEDQRRSYTLVLAMRSWFFSAFSDLLREPATKEKAR